MKIVISESQYQRLVETEEEQEVLEIPSLKIFGKSKGVAWMRLQELLKKRGNPPYSIGGDLDLSELPIESLGNLTSVGGNLNLFGVQIKSLGNLVSVGGDVRINYTPIESLGSLESVGEDLHLARTPIESLGNLKFVGGDLYMRGTPLSKMYSKEEIREMVNVGGGIHFN